MEEDERGVPRRRPRFTSVFEEAVYYAMMPAIRHVRLAQSLRASGLTLPLYDPYPENGPPVSMQPPPPAILVPSPVTVTIPVHPPTAALHVQFHPPAPLPIPAVAAVTGSLPIPTPLAPSPSSLSPSSPPSSPAITSSAHAPSPDAASPEYSVTSNNDTNSLLVISNLPSMPETSSTPAVDASNSTLLVVSLPIPTSEKSSHMSLPRGTKRERPSDSDFEESTRETITSKFASISQTGNASTLDGTARNVRQRVHTDKPEAVGEDTDTGMERLDEHLNASTATCVTQPVDCNVRPRVQNGKGKAAEDGTNAV